MQRFNGKTYLKIDISNAYGLDKKSWDERLTWFQEHEDHLDQMIPQAEDPAMFYAGLQALRDVEAGRPIGYPISLDATASGMQLLAVLTGDRSAAQLCNVVDTGTREDAYTLIYKAMLSKIGEGAKIKREDTKQAIMTSLYGSTAVPKEVFGEGALLNIFIETMQELAPAAWELNQAFLDIWNPEALSNDWVLPDNFHVHCKVMATVKERVNFLNEPHDVTYKVNAPKEQGRSLGANTVHSLDGLIVREITRRCDYDPAWISLVQSLLDQEAVSHFTTKKEKDEARRMVGILWDHYVQSGYLSARILDYLDTETLTMVEEAPIRELITSLPLKPFKVLSVHDCFRVLPGYANDLREQYNRQLMLIAKSDMLQYLLSQLLGRPIQINKMDPTLYKDILEADYALS